MLPEASSTENADSVALHNRVEPQRYAWRRHMTFWRQRCTSAKSLHPPGKLHLCLQGPLDSVTDRSPQIPVHRRPERSSQVFAILLGSLISDYNCLRRSLPIIPAAFPIDGLKRRCCLFWQPHASSIMRRAIIWQVLSGPIIRFALHNSLILSPCVRPVRSLPFHTASSSTSPPSLLQEAFFHGKPPPIEPGN